MSDQWSQDRNLCGPYELRAEVNVSFIEVGTMVGRGEETNGRKQWLGEKEASTYRFVASFKSNLYLLSGFIVRGSIYTHCSFLRQVISSSQCSTYQLRYPFFFFLSVLTIQIICFKYSIVLMEECHMYGHVGTALFMNKIHGTTL
jgi:hypothetical protein